eukprot:TRINITY_DN32570_c0_g1_i1.p1 TRINITY_DN32570_c0_g1~~TRINITY_DN32570_c0_g1_i1.p1  ORF type:complete len:295 (+),score=34.62 TRINITY_DN32570_c0_g1_i1:53-937(+)
MEKVVSLIKPPDGSLPKILCLVGAGISVAAGIPDFRSPETGVYAQLEKQYNLEDPESVFNIDYFHKQPEVFYKVERDTWPRQDPNPTPVHAFFALLKEKGLLLRVWTQNIDGLERKVGLTNKELVECHGTMAAAHCETCGAKYSGQWYKEQLFGTEVGVVHCENSLDQGGDEADAKVCGGPVRPDIVFFGESLPDRFAAARWDCKDADVVLILGTSLVVHPFADMVKKPGPHVPRVLINNKQVGANVGLKVGAGSRDVFLQGDCQTVIEELVSALDWEGGFCGLKEKLGVETKL